MKTFDNILEESLLDNIIQGAGDTAASFLQNLPNKKAKNWADKHWEKSYPEEFATFKKERDLKLRDEEEALYPLKKKARLRDEAIDDMMQKASGYKGLKSPNDWKAYIDEVAIKDPEFKEFFSQKGPISMKRAIIATLYKYGRISKQIYNTCMEKMDKKETLYKAPKNSKSDSKKEELFESVFRENLEDDDDYEYDTWENNENMMYRAMEGSDDDDDDVEWGNQKTERFRMEHDDLDDQCWQQLTDWNELPEYDETVFEALIDGEIDEETAKKILVFCYHWELEDVERELNSTGEEVDGGVMGSINASRHQQDIWKGAGLDDDSLDDMGNIVYRDDIEDDEDYESGYESEYDSDGAVSLDDLEDKYEDDEWEDWN